MASRFPDGVHLQEILDVQFDDGKGVVLKVNVLNGDGSILVLQPQQVDVGIMYVAGRISEPCFRLWCAISGSLLEMPVIIIGGKGVNVLFQLALAAFMACAAIYCPGAR